MAVKLLRGPPRLTQGFHVDGTGGGNARVLVGLVARTTSLVYFPSKVSLIGFLLRFLRGLRVNCRGSRLLPILVFRRKLASAFLVLLGSSDNPSDSN